MQRIAILGSTGSIGRNTQEVVRQLPDRFKIVAISANSNVGFLVRQIREFRPKFVCVRDAFVLSNLRREISLRGVRIFTGRDGLVAMVKEKIIDKVVLAISGSAALPPLLAAIESKKTIALANKEALVMAGSIIMERALKNKVKIIPIDSEQSAIWQCLKEENRLNLKRIYLTASGGPLRKFSPKQIRQVTVSQVLNHPRWKMGKKISVDSATLMNKGLEVLEAVFLFNICPEKIKVLIHPQAIIHSMVEFVDSVVIAQLSVTDMRIPIQYALSYPDRLENKFGELDFYRLRSLDFEAPDFGKFPCLGLAYRAACEMGTMPCVLNAANEVSVEKFLKGELKFFQISDVVDKTMRRHRNKVKPSLNNIMEADSWARCEASEIIHKLN